jgi:hypothetical protein
MSDAPSQVSERQLKELYLRTVVSKASLNVKKSEDRSQNSE